MTVKLDTSTALSPNVFGHQGAAVAVPCMPWLGAASPMASQILSQLIPTSDCLVGQFFIALFLAAYTY